MMQRGKIITIFVMMVLFGFSGCGGGSGHEEGAQTPILNTLNKTQSQPGPFSAGKFGRIDLTQKQYDTLGINDGKNVLDGGELIDIRNLYERKNSQPVEAVKNLLVYEIREDNGRGKRSLNPDFVKEVTAFVGGDKNKKIVLICHSGSRSAKAAKLLSDNGFTNVYDIQGGLNEWSKHFHTTTFHLSES